MNLTETERSKFKLGGLFALLPVLILFVFFFLLSTNSTYDILIWNVFVYSILPSGLIAVSILVNMKPPAHSFWSALHILGVSWSSILIVTGILAAFLQTVFLIA